jgi:predicted TIM-barrel enzyme
MELYTIAHVFTPEEGGQMAEAGVHMVVPHVGLTAGASLDQSTPSAYPKPINGFRP